MTIRITNSICDLIRETINRDSAMPETPEQSFARLQSHVAQLAEHFESVQVFVTRVDGSGTLALQHGAGNWYARYGQMREWMIRQEENTRIEQRAKENRE